MSYINYPGTAQLGQPDPVLEPERYQAWLQVTQHIQSGDRSTASYKGFAQGGGIKNTTEYNAGRSGNVPPTPTYGLPPPPSQMNWPGGHAPVAPTPAAPHFAAPVTGGVLAPGAPLFGLVPPPNPIPLQPIVSGAPPLPP